MEAIAMYEKGMKTVSDSQVETIHQLRYIDINGQGRLFGGRLLEWIDETAALAAERHAGMNVTTASISHLDFKEGAYLNDTIVLVARVTYVGRTSIEVRCDTYLEDLETGMRHSINRAFLTEVCVDKEGHPTPVPYGLKIESVAEQARYEGALNRIKMRKLANQEGF